MQLPGLRQSLRVLRNSYKQIHMMAAKDLNNSSYKAFSYFLLSGLLNSYGLSNEDMNVWDDVFQRLEICY